MKTSENDSSVGVVKPFAIRRSATVGVFAIFALVLSFLYGVNKWSIGSVEAWTTDFGRVSCGIDAGRQYLTSGVCPVVGYPAGSSTANGLIMNQLPVVLGLVLPIPVEWVLTIWYLILIMAALAGAFYCFLRLGLRHSVAIVASLVWMVNPSVIGMRSFGSTFWGLLLLPAFIWVALSCFEKLRKSEKTAIKIFAILLWSSTATLSLQIDGYGYVMTQACVAVLTIVAPLMARHPRWKDALQGTALFGIGFVTSYWLYTVPRGGGGDWDPMPLDFFRGMGADVVSLFFPSGNFAWAQMLGFTMDPTWRWGDGTNNAWNYIGLATVAMLVVGALWARRGKGAIGPWLLIGGVALVLALGPSLKFNAISGPPEIPVTMSSYLMPADEATLAWPWESLFVSIPGLSMMRAIYRWMVVVRMALIVIGGLTFQRIWDKYGRTWRGWTTLAIFGVAIVATLPAFQVSLPKQLGTARSFSSFQNEVPAELDAALPDEGVIAISSPVSLGNDFLAPFLATQSNIVLFNTAGDKDLAEAENHWSSEALDVIVTRDNYLDSVLTLLSSEQADAVVITDFDLRWGISQWPNHTYEDISKSYVQELRSAPELRIEEYPDFTVVTLAD